MQVQGEFPMGVFSMCELFGMSCQQPDRAVHSLLSFKEFSGENRDGWGLAYYQDGKAVIEREPGGAGSSEKFRALIRNAASRIIIAHLRSATRGVVCTNNCHPFRRDLCDRDWVFAHNGTIPGIPLHPRSEGTTDSEQAFHVLADAIESSMNRPGFHGLYPAVKDGIRTLFERYSRDITFNFLLSDGSVLYAFNHYAAAPLYISRREKDYGGAIVISTKKLGSPHYASWEKIPPDRVVVVSDGRLLVVSKKI